MSDYIKFRCPECGKGMKTTPERAGEFVQCPECDSPVQIPEQEQSVALDYTENEFRDLKRRVTRKRNGPEINLGALFGATYQLAFVACLILAIAGLVPWHIPIALFVGIIISIVLSTHSKTIGPIMKNKS